MPGQTLSEIRQLLAQAGLAPLHGFGQNFLIDLNLMRKLVDAAQIGDADTILEVGPGTGSLTELLLERGARVIAVEIDHGLQQLLRNRLGSQERFTLIAGDALAGKHALHPALTEELLRQAPGPGGSRKLVANLPYQVATPLVVELLLFVPPLERLVCSIQKEVAERLAAPSGTPEYGPLSVVAQALARIERIAHLPPTAFWPVPKVESALVKLVPLAPAAQRVADPAGFARFVQVGFTQRRKMLRRLLRDLNIPEGEALFEAAGVNPQARPEEVSVPQWQALYARWSSFARG